MEPSRTLTVKLLFLLSTTNIICLHGNPIADLNCTNDYLFTINCTMRLAPSGNTSGVSAPYRLQFKETTERTTFECLLTKNSHDDYYFCSGNKSDQKPDNNDGDDEEEDDDEDYPQAFTDMDIYEVSLCGRSDKCDVLIPEYSPETNIKPNAPCCLTLQHNSSQHCFSWRSTYEEYEEGTDMGRALVFQLQFFRTGVQNQVKARDINTGRTEFTVDDHNFEPDSDYVARVRSCPDQVHYRGEWSDWSSEVQWRTDISTVKSKTDFPTFLLELGLKVFLPLGLLLPLVFLICYASVKTLKQRIFIPTPAPYVHSLFAECQGDFKSWVITQEETADMLKAEASLRIDSVTKCPEIAAAPPQAWPQPRLSHHHQLLLLMEKEEGGHVYRNLVQSQYNASLPDDGYAASTAEPWSAQGSPTLGSPPGSPAQGDSGCWLRSDASLERDSAWYVNNYCTLSAFAQTAAISPQHQKLMTPCYSEDSRL